MTAATGQPVKTKQHQQTSFQITPTHWVVARPGRHGTWDVVEIAVGLASKTHGNYWRRTAAEVIAAAVAATRIHNNLTVEDHR